MREALGAAGFDQVELVHEPVAAAHAVRRAPRPRRAGPDRRLRRRHQRLLAGPGRARAGPRSWPPPGSRSPATASTPGSSTTPSRRPSAAAPATGPSSAPRPRCPGWIFNRLRRWHHLSFLRSPETLALLDRIRHGAVAPDAIARLCRRRRGRPRPAPARRGRGREGGAVGRPPPPSCGSTRPGVAVDAAVARAAFDAWIDGELDAIDGAVGEALAAAGADARDVDRVFTTGGSSSVPAVRARLAARFGADRLVGGERADLGRRRAAPRSPPAGDPGQTAAPGRPAGPPPVLASSRRASGAVPPHPHRQPGRGRRAGRAGLRSPGHHAGVRGQRGRPRRALHPATARSSSSARAAPRTATSTPSAWSRPRSRPAAPPSTRAGASCRRTRCSRPWPPSTA